MHIILSIIGVLLILAFIGEMLEGGRNYSIRERFKEEPWGMWILTIWTALTILIGVLA